MDKSPGGMIGYKVSAKCGEIWSELSHSSVYVTGPCLYMYL